MLRINLRLWCSLENWVVSGSLLVGSLPLGPCKWGTATEFEISTLGPSNLPVSVTHGNR